MSTCDAGGAREWDLEKRKRKGESWMRLLENRGVHDDDQGDTWH